jgi:hypothetical protein
MNAEDLMSECDLDSMEEAEFLLTLPPEAIDLVRSRGAFVGCQHQHDWPQGVKNPCEGKPHGMELCVNVNDTFAYACADAEPVTREEIVEVADLVRKHGSLAVVCWVARRRNEKPVVEYCESPEYQVVWKALYGDLKVADNYCNKAIPRC